MPDEVDKVEVLSDRLGRPAATTGLLDEREAGVDACHIVVQVISRDCRSYDVLVAQARRHGEAGRKDKLLDQLAVVQVVSLSVLQFVFRRRLAPLPLPFRGEGISSAR